MRQIGKAALVLPVWLVLSIVLSPGIKAYPVRPFDAKYLLDSADVVCHVKVLSVRPQEIEKDSSFHPALVTDGAVARARVINVMKGEAAHAVKIVFRRPTDTVSYTQLSAGEECIVFLRSGDGHFRFVDDHNGKLRIPPHEAIQYRSESPEDRVVAELVYATKADSGLIRLVCAEQLGNFAHPEAVARLEELAAAEDMAVQGVAYAALIRLDCPPDAQRLAAFFAREDDTRSGQRFGTTGYSNGHLKGGILRELHVRFNVIRADFDLRYTGEKYIVRKRAARVAAARWRDFDLIGFLDSAPWQERDTRDVIDNRVIADIVAYQIDPKGRPAFISKTYRAGSRAIVIGLLQSSERQIRFSAARAADMMIAEPHKFPYPQKRRGEEIDAYVNACRDWLGEHGGWAGE